MLRWETVDAWYACRDLVLVALLGNSAPLTPSDREAVERFLRIDRAVVEETGVGE